MIVGLMTLAAAAAAPARPYEFQSIPLGITIDEFRALPKNKDHVACSNDKGERLGPDEQYLKDPILADIGVVQCVYAFWRPETPTIGELSGIPLADGAFATEDYGFRFVTDPKDHALRLYEVRLVVHIRWAPSIMSTLTANYGPPKSTVAKVSQTRLGALVQGKTSVWTNGVSSIAVDAPGQTTNDVIVAYRLLRLAGPVVAAQKSPPPAKSL